MGGGENVERVQNRARASIVVRGDHIVGHPESDPCHPRKAVFLCFVSADYPFNSSSRTGRIVLVFVFRAGLDWIGQPD